MDEFRKYAIKHRGISSTAFDKYTSVVTNYLNPTIIEERQLNVAQMDVFSRLMMDRIIFLGVPIDDTVANVIQAQLLFLESSDNSRDITIYINSPGGSVYAGLGIYDTMQLISPEIQTVCTGLAASMASVLLCAGSKGRRAALACADTPATRWRRRSGQRHRNHRPRNWQTETRTLRNHRQTLRPAFRQNMGRRRPRLLDDIARSP